MKTTYLDKTLNKVARFISDSNLFTYDSNILAGVSGGVDSMFLLYALKKLGYNVAAAHLNHCLRGRDADGDQIFVSDFCKEFYIPFYTCSIDVMETAQREKISVETAARKERYDFFRRIYKENGYNRLATGHHLNDNAESFIMHVLRGSGMKGLGGIRPKSCLYDMEVVRPMICLSKNEILRYACDSGIKFREDSSNKDDRYRRNDIRSNIIPAIEERGGLQTIFRLCNIVENDDSFLNDYVKKLIDENVFIKKGDGCVKVSFSVKWFNELHISCKRRILFALFNRVGVSHCTFLHINEAIELCRRNYGGKYLKLPGKVRFTLRKGVITITNQIRKG